MRWRKHTAVESAVPSGFVESTSGFDAVGTARTIASRAEGFTLAELLVTTGVLVLLVLLASQLFNGAATITTLGHKQMDADSQARQLFDRMAVDFAQMVKRRDVDYYLKSTSPSPTVPPSRTLPQPGNDQIAFYSSVPGYIPTSNYQSPLSLVAYRVNATSNKMERMGKTLIWNGAPTPIPSPIATPAPTGTPTPVVYTPTVFIPVPLASPLPGQDFPAPTPTPPLPTPAWPEAGSATTSWSDSEVIGPQVFRFEYYYLMKNGGFSDVPWSSPDTSVSGMQDVAAIVVDIAVIDPKSKVLLSDTTNPPQIAQVASQLIDWGNTACAGCPTQTQWQNTPGLLLAQWQNTINGITSLPRAALSGIRVYERFIYLSPPVQ